MKVTVYKRKNRKNWTARWVDRLTGKRKERTTGETTRRNAERYAAKLEAELATGGGAGHVSWHEFRNSYFREYVANLRPASKEKIAATFNVLERLLEPSRADFTSRDVGRFAAALRQPYLGQDEKTERTRSPATIRGHLINLQTALRWAHRQGMISQIPDFNLPAKTAKAKGRAITAEELDRMLDATPNVVGAAAADSWVWLLRGLWWSGLRLGEACRLSWTDTGTGLWVDLEGRRPMLRIDAWADKGKRERILPMAPEFAEMLEAVPPHQRRGHVFKPLQRDGQTIGKRRDWVGRTVRKIGAAAGVVTTVNQDGRQSTASAHDFRRAFGTRWAERILPQHLKELMRHQDIKTTMEFYVSQNAQATAAAVWAAYAGTRSEKNRCNTSYTQATHKLHTSYNCRQNTPAGDKTGDTQPKLAADQKTENEKSP
jgi:integrase